MNLSRPARHLPRPVRRAVRGAVVRYRRIGLVADDAMLVSYPKSGSTWLRFLLAHALTGVEADFDSIRDTVPPIGRQRLGPALVGERGRLVRSHEPIRPGWVRPGQPVVYLVRDGRDVALSYLAHERHYERFDGDPASFVSLFLEGGVDSYGSWPDHVLGALATRDAGSNPFLLVRYEELRRQPAEELERVLAFLGAGAGAVPLDAVVAANTKERMREKEERSTFLAAQRTDGSSIVGSDQRQSWATLVPAEVRERFDAMCGRALSAAGYG